MEFDFRTDIEAVAFCNRIVGEMVRKFGISPEEAVKRINRTWAGLDLRGDEHDIYHWSESNWAEKIYEGYEDLKVIGLSDMTREEIIERRRQFIERCNNFRHPDLPPRKPGNADA